ncbi:MAG: permease, partial [Candidatus Eremiobacteraeota bacterium]|nr:permease [Candidatus Eremiobacteraeota bacterium]
MTVSESVTLERDDNMRRLLAGAIVFLLVAVAGLFFVKWWPYWHKSFTAANTHSIGASIVSGKGVQPQAAGLAAAWQYSLAYFKAVWQAVVLALILGASIQVLVPRAWLVRMLGGSGVRPAMIAGAASMAGMMCTCCTAPIVVGMRKQRAGMGSALAFLVGNPILNPATIIFMGFVLGWAFAGLRIVFGLALVVLVAFAADRYAQRTGENQTEHVVSLAPIEDAHRSTGSLIR